MSGRARVVRVSDSVLVLKLAGPAQLRRARGARAGTASTPHVWGARDRLGNIHERRLRECPDAAPTRLDGLHQHVRLHSRGQHCGGNRRWAASHQCVSAWALTLAKQAKRGVGTHKRLPASPPPSEGWRPRPGRRRSRRPVRCGAHEFTTPEGRNARGRGSLDGPGAIRAAGRVPHNRVWRLSATHLGEDDVKGVAGAAAFQQSRHFLPALTVDHLIGRLPEKLHRRADVLRRQRGAGEEQHLCRGRVRPGWAASGAARNRDVQRRLRARRRVCSPGALPETPAGCRSWAPGA